MALNNLKIIYSGSSYIQVPCSRWDEDGWNVSLEFIASSSNRNTLLNNIVPGAVGELYNILGTPKYIDTTYNSGNTLWLTPILGTSLYSLRDSTKIAVKRYSDTLLRWDLYKIKIDGVKL